MAKREPYNPLLKSYPDSEKVNAVSIGAETLYTRLLAQSDDQDHYYGDPRLILGKLFTIRWQAGQVCEVDIGLWTDELVAVKLVMRYEAGGKSYLELLDCRKAIRKDRPLDIRFPDNGFQMSAKCPPNDGQVTVKCPAQPNPTQPNRTDQAAAVSWHPGTKTFEVPDSILAEYEDRWPNRPRKTILQAIKDCGVWWGTGKKVPKRPQSCVTNWLKKEFGEPVDPGPEESRLAADRNILAELEAS